MAPATVEATKPGGIGKARTGIAGFDEITGGGLPRGRATAIYGNVGSGKSVFAMECLVHAAREGDEPGVFLSFAESEKEIIENGESLGFDLSALEASGKLVIDSARMDPGEIAGTGGYTLDGLLVRLEHAIDRIGAKRVVIDAINVLAEAIPHPAILRAELRRLLDGLKARGITTLVTLEVAEQSEFPVAEYLADCVIHLRFSLEKGVATRRLRVIKYRGSSHRMNEYAFLIASRGITVTPVTGVSLDYPSPDERVSMGIPGLDDMLAGGVYRGDTVLIVGGAGTGKTSFAVSMADATCARGDRCLYFALEEAHSQIVRNMRSMGFDLARYMETDLLRIRSARPGSEGLEPYLAYMIEEIEAFDPHVVVIDPITPFLAMGLPEDVRGTLTRLLGFLKARGVTAVNTMLSSEREALDENTYIISLVDDIIILRNVELAGERNRATSVLKARGIAHSKQVREFRLTSHGVDLLEVFTGAEGGAVGASRAGLEAGTQSEETRRRAEAQDRRAALEATRRALDARIEQLRAEFAIKELETQGLLRESEALAARARTGRESVREARASPSSGDDHDAEGS
ncbi:MAG: circadian clock protein KaiC [Candidatus Thermoplasmatota archaeon]